MEDGPVLERMTRNAHSRRELLYLRALEKGEAQEVRSLLHVDPNIVQRLRAMGIDPEEGGRREWESPRERRERMGRLWEACWRHHARRP